MPKLHPIEITLDADLLLKGRRHFTRVVEEYYKENHEIEVAIFEMDIKPVIPLQAVDGLYILYTVTPTKYNF